MLPQWLWIEDGKEVSKKNKFFLPKFNLPKLFLL